jgi:Putative restriction endonuclease
MDLTTSTSGAAAVADLAAERLYRVSPALYRGLVEHGLIDPGEVALADGLLVREPARGYGAGAERLYRMPLGVYDEVAAIGLLGPSDKTELIDGLLVTKMTKGDPHIVATQLTTKVLGDLLPGGWHIGKEDPIGLPSGPTGHASVPEPDVTVVRGGIRDYLTHKPRPGDVSLVVEVAESSLREDRGKLTRYAWANVPVAWIVNLNDRVVEVSTDPTGPEAPARYRAVTTYRPGDEVPVILDGREVGRVAVADLLP